MTVQHLVLLVGSMLSVSIGAKACVMLTLRYCVVGGCWRLMLQWSQTGSSGSLSSSCVNRFT